MLRRMADGSDELVALMFEQGVAQAVIDRDGRVLRVNVALRDALGGADPCAASADATHVSALFGAGVREAVWQDLRQRLDGVVPAMSLPPLPLAGQDAPSDKHQVRLAATALREPGGGIGGLLLQLVDVTSQLALEASLAQGQALRLLGRSVAGIAHDFNNLLGVILTASSEQLSRPGLDGEAHEDLRQIHAGAERGAALVRQLLELGRGRVGEPRAVETGPALRALAGLLRVVLGSGIRLQLELCGSVAMVRIDPVLLDRLLLNLCVNAGQAMPSGGTLTLVEGTLDIAGAGGLDIAPECILPGGIIRAGRYVTIDVRDTGPGLPPAIRSRLSEPFATTRDGAGGTGLGLWSVRDAVGRCGGFVTVQSVPGRGTVFRVHLPRHDGPLEHPIAAAAGHLHEPRRRGTVLLVDDEPALLRLAERALARAGWGVLAAASALDGLAAARAADPPPLVVVSDLAMPDLDGARLIGAIREFCPTMPALLTSGYDAAPQAAGGASPATRFLAKPYTMQALVEAVADLTAATQPAASDP